MKIAPQDRVRAAISGAVFFAVFLLFHFDVLKRFELVTYDYRCLIRGTRTADARIAVIEISDDSVAKIGRWPWDRDWHAALVKILSEAGAKAIVFDVLFSESSDIQKDAAFAKAIQESGRVYLAEVYQGVDEGKAGRFLTSLPEFQRAAKGTGHINLKPDVDGVMRRIELFYDKGAVPQLSLAVARDILGTERDHVLRSIPLDKEAKFIINWLGRWKETFRHYSYVDVITSYAASQKGDKPVLDLSGFRDKICFVGTTAAGLFDIRPTPLEPSYPAVGVNLTILNNLLERRFIRSANYWQSLLVLLGLVVFLFYILKLPSYLRSALWISMTAFVYIIVGLVLFSLFDFWINLVYPLVLIFAMYFFVTLYNQLSIAIERTRLLKLATRDSLTGLFNIGHFKLLLKAEMTTIALRREKALSLVMGDVDNFKQANDTYGHITGDTVLKEVAQAVRSNCRALDVAARYGGEEFILMLPGANVDQAYKVAENIRKAVENKIFFHEKGDFKTSLSMGVTQISPDDKDIEAIVARADRALYEAKQAGKNRVIIASDSPRFQPSPA